MISVVTLFQKSRLLFLLLGMLSSLNACAIFKPIPTKPIHYYTLVGMPLSCCHTVQKTRHTILVTQPRTSGTYSNTRMIYSPACYQIQYFSQNQWADTPPHMLHPLLIKALHNTGCFHAIINMRGCIYYDRILNSQLLSFQQEFLTQPSRFRIALRVQLINARTNHIIATKEFIVVQPTILDTPYGGAIAANIATNKILQAIADFCLDWV